MSGLHGGDIWGLGAEHGLEPDQVLDFSANLNPFGPPEGVLRLLADARFLVRNYPDPDYAELRAGLAAADGLDPAQVVPGNGASELIRELLLALRPASVLVCRPGFAEYARAAERLGIPVLAHDGDPVDRFRPVGLAERIRRDRPGLVFLCSPNNPTGLQLERRELESLLEACESAGSWLVLDETFIELSRRGRAASLAGLLTAPGGAARKLAVLRAHTKSFALAGLRLGWLLAPAPVAAVVRAGMVPWSVNGLAARLGRLHETEAAYVARTRAWVAAEPDRLVAAMRAGADQGNGVAAVLSTDVNFVLARLEPGRAAAELRRRLLGRGILIRDCANFGGLGPEWFRVAVRLPEENDRLVAALALRD